jgi:DnaJ-class molecular chaperone
MRHCMRCPACRGRGTTDGAIPCEMCHGSGLARPWRDESPAPRDDAMGDTGEV